MIRTNWKAAAVAQAVSRRRAKDLDGHRLLASFDGQAPLGRESPDAPPAVRRVQAVAREVIDTVKGGGLLFAYANDPAWLASSEYLGDCAAADAAIG